MIVGRVTAAGAPLWGAWVAAVPEVDSADVSPESTRPAALVQTARDGGYRLEGLAPGSYALTVTTTAATAFIRGGQALRAGEPPLERSLELPEAPGHRLSGLLRGPQGQPLPGALLRAVRFSEDRGDVFYGKADEAGRFVLRLPPAPYALLALTPELDADPKILDLRAADQEVELTLLPAAAPASAEVEAWIRANAVRLSGVEAGSDRADLAPFTAMVQDATVVSLGEATHGTADFFQLKHRLLEHLVTELGFRVFAIEANLPEAFAVDEYLQTGRGDPDKLLGGLYFWTWNTEEVRDLIRWMRAYNAAPEHREKLHFYGFDLQFAELALGRALDYLKKVDPRWAPPAVLQRMTDPCGSQPGKLPADAEERRAAVSALERRLEEGRAQHIARSSAAQWELGRQYARIVAQQLSLNGTGNLNGQRDRAMAENVRWIQAREHGAKMVLWAHNAHISDLGYLGLRSMGQWLRDALGPKVVSVGFTFDHGSFRAVEMPVHLKHGVRDFEVEPAAAASIAGELAALGLERALFDLRSLAPGSAARTWFEAGRPWRDLESTYWVPKPGAASKGMRMNITKAFDVLVFLKETRASRALPWGRGRQLPPGAAPLNLDFEEGLEGWFLPDAAPAFDFELKTVDRGVKHGQRAASLARAAGPHLGAYCARLSQRAETGSFAGRSLRLRLWAEARQLRGPAPRLWLSAGDGAAEVSLKGEGWQELELNIQVPEDAPFLSYGLAFSGEGEVLLDDLRFEQP